MLPSNIENTKDQELTGSTLEADIDDAFSAKVQNEPDKTDESSTPTAKQEEEVIKKKYGGLIPKKVPLISKDHERAFFDSADWALGKDGVHKPKGTLEALLPKWQPTPHHQTRSRRFANAPPSDANEGEDVDETATHDTVNEGDTNITSKDIQKGDEDLNLDHLSNK